MKPVKYKKLMQKLYRAKNKGCQLHKLKLTQAKKGYLKNRDFVYFRRDGFWNGLQQWRIVLTDKGIEHCKKMGIE
jgi:hypothetical protein